MRAELLGHLVAAQFEIEAAMNEMGGNASAISDGKTQLQLLSALQQQIGTANPTALAGMRGEVIATATAAQAVAQQSRANAVANDRMAELRDVTNATRQTIGDVAQDLFEKKKLDPYLQFDSAQDEADYRKREAERQAYIKTELAKGTPEGALNAATATKEQLEDARDHGAGASPDFDAMYSKTIKAADAQRAAMPQQSTEPEKAVAQPPDNAPSDLDAIAATLRMAGVAVPDQSNKPLTAHGLAAVASTEPEYLGIKA